MANCAHQESHHGNRLNVEEHVLEGLPTGSDPELPPDGGYGWVCVAACFNINCFTWGVVAVSSWNFIWELFRLTDI
jgi:hypothetical protein